MFATPVAPSSHAYHPSGQAALHCSFSSRQDPEQRIRRRLQDIRASRWSDFAGLTMADAAVDRRWSGRGDYYNGGGGGSRKRSRRGMLIALIFSDHQLRRLYLRVLRRLKFLSLRLDFEDDSRPPARREYREPLSIRIRRQVLTIADSVRQLCLHPILCPNATDTSF